MRKFSHERSCASFRSRGRLSKDIGHHKYSKPSYQVKKIASTWHVSLNTILMLHHPLPQHQYPLLDLHTVNSTRFKFHIEMTYAPQYIPNPLSFSSCRLAAADFLLAYAVRTQDYKLTHRQNLPLAQDYIRCPCIISYHDLVFTLDFSSRFVEPTVRPWIVTGAAMTLAGACVGKMGVDWGKIV